LTKRLHSSHSAFFRCLLLLLLFAAGAPVLQAQTASEFTISLQREVKMQGQVEMPLEDAVILPESLSIRSSKGLLLLGRDYRFDPFTQTVHLLDAALMHHPLHLSYRVLRLEIPPTFQLQNQSELPWYNEENDSLSTQVQADLPKRNTRLSSGLRSSGSFLRGVRVASGGSMVMESGLQLSVTGQVGPNVQVEAFLSDRNSPIQPEGNSQSLEEIDRIHVKVQSPSWRVLMGDFDLRMRQGRYLNYQRTVDGLQGGYQTADARALMHFALARGRYHRLEFLGQDGVQGPWQLLAESGSSQIVVLAGSERVFLDGVELRRGEDQDFVMDYGLGQLRFTARHPIRRDHRIVIEYQYSERLYERSLYGADLVWGEGGALTFTLGVAGESDDENQALSQFLGDEDRARLAEAGDSIASAWGSGVREVEPGEGHYRRIDAQAGQWGHFEFAEIIPVAEDSLYIFDLRFTKLEPATGILGDYSRQFTTSGQAWFQFEGEEEGDWAPVLPLSAPTSHELVDATLALKQGPWTLAVETALSRKDRNLFSKLDDADNTALAFEASCAFDADSFLIQERSWKPRFALTMGREAEDFELLQPDGDVNFDRDKGFSRAGGMDHLKSAFALRCDSNFVSAHFSQFRRDTLRSQVLNPSWMWRPGQGPWTKGEFILRDLEGLSSYARRELQVGYDRQAWTLESLLAKERLQLPHTIDSLRPSEKTAWVEMALRGPLTDNVWMQHEQHRRIFSRRAAKEGWREHWEYRSWKQRFLMSGRLQGRIDWTSSHLEPLASDSSASHTHVADLALRRTASTWQANMAYRAHKSLERERLTQYVQVDSLTGTHSQDPLYPGIFVPDPDGDYIALALETGLYQESALVEGDWNFRWFPKGEWRGQHSLGLKATSTSGDPLELYALLPRALVGDSVRFMQIRTRHDVEYRPKGKADWRLRLKGERGIDRMQILVRNERVMRGLALRRQQRMGHYHLRLEVEWRDDRRSYLERPSADHHFQSAQVDMESSVTLTSAWTLKFSSLFENGNEKLKSLSAKRAEIASRLQWRGSRGQFSLKGSWQKAWSAEEQIPYEMLRGARVGRTLRANLDASLRWGKSTRLSLNWKIDALPDRKAWQSGRLQIQSFF
jgi:hypothetical protein